MRRAAWIGALLVLLASLTPRVATASTNLLFSTLPRPMALAGAYTALTEDAGALYYNPAGLASVDGSYLALAFLLSFTDFSAERAGQAVDLETPRDEGYGIHLAWSPRSILDGDLGFGFSVLLPHRRALRFAVHKFDDPYFVLYENSVEVLEVRLGAAYEFFDTLSIGASLLLLAGLDGSVEISSPFQDADPEKQDPEKRTSLAVDALLPNRTFFTLGAQVRVTDDLKLGLSFRQATYVPIDLPIDFTVELLGLEPIRTVANLNVKVKYSPAELNLGAAYRVAPSLLLTADLGFALYSRYQIPYGNVTIDRRLNPDIALLPPRAASTSLRNLWIPRVGFEWSPTPAARVRGGYYYFRSFIRRADSPVLDSDKHSLTFGGSYGIGEHFLTEGNALDLTAAGQIVMFTPRTTADHDHAGLAFATTFGAEFRY